MIINIVMIIKNRIGGKDEMLLGDFALEPSENLIFLEMDFADFIDFKRL